jgi:hypothetical protein
VATASAANASNVLFTSFSRDRPGRADPDRALTSVSNKGATRERASWGPDAKIVSWPWGMLAVLDDNLGAAGLHLSAEETVMLDEASTPIIDDYP